MPPIFDDADFDYLRANQTAKYPLPFSLPRANPKPATLIVCYSGESNEKFVKARSSSVFRTAKGDDAERMWREAFSRHVIVGWENVLRGDGSAITYTPAGGAELLQRLGESAERSDIVNRLILFTLDANNFTAPLVEAAELGEK